MVFEARKDKIGLGVILFPFLDGNILSDSILYFSDLKIVLNIRSNT